jgi:flagellar hook-associated protein 3 FlgL
MARVQTRLDQATREVATGRHHDIGLALGASTARTIDARQQLGDIDAIIATNGLAVDRLAVTQSALAAMVEIADGFFTTLVSASRSGVDRATLVEDARARLGALTGLANATGNGAHVFAAANADAAPLADYLVEPMPASRSAVMGAFSTAFGFPSDDAQVSSIEPAQLQAFLEGPFASLFQGPDWQSLFSSASDDAVVLRISRNETIALDVSTNSPGIRRLMSALVAVVDLGTRNLDAEAFQAFAASVAESASAASGELIRDQAAVGAVQDRLAHASERMTAERGLLQAAIGRLESVDQAEASTRLNLLSTQLELSYALTARLQKLSLLDYL